ncbi:hypothetical protein GCM10020295_42720 [Streptomyces cinereospinus]
MERGHIELDRAGLLNLLASELHVHPNDLIGRPYNSSPAENQWQASAAAIMRELRCYDLAPVFDGTPRPASQLWQKRSGYRVPAPPAARWARSPRRPSGAASPIRPATPGVQSGAPLGA